MITTRLSTLQDHSILYELYIEAMKGHIEQIWGWDKAWQKNDFETALQGTITYVIESDATFLGYFQLEQIEHYDYLRMFILSKQHRSKGIGPTVLQKLLKDSQAKQGTLKLRVFKINTAALRFYQREGWHIAETEDAFYLMEYSANI